ncbi:DUF1656 domain-containing protein [Mesorhizobium sp. SP-1A]|jgi:hypothetical protein|uniref:DUF1656 domain-containing protein n=1 Tax=Mesorhizobium sp. SP-1A TaxID=3077840 RepID=UPI0028F6D5DA|nr:DUF1656 domain-containing protein [Mesorhizobium sp. SP-1A]
MRPEIDIYGVFIPTLGALAVLCFMVNAVVRRVLARAGFYRFVWHRPLFDAAMYVCLLGTSVFVLDRILQ